MESPGQEVVCISCFSVWTPEQGAVIEDDATRKTDSTVGEDTFEGNVV